MAALTGHVPLPVPEVGAERQPRRAFTGAPGQGAAAGVAEVRVCAAGLLPPWVAANESVVGLAPMAGGTGAALTVKETGMVTGVAPDALRVMVSL